MSEKSGTLYVVATPIGNMGDITARAAEVLGVVDVIAAEDTRVTRRLLTRLGIKSRLVSYRDENERQLAPRLVAELVAGKSVAIVCDAGTPCISDPGYRLVHAASTAGVEVVAVPGPSAVTALLSVSGLPTDRFSFEGFAPTKPGARRELLEGLRGAARTVIFYESPRRVVAFLGEIERCFDDPRVAVGRELTKVHEEVLRGRAHEVAAEIERRGARGEFVIAVHVPETTAPAEAAADGERWIRQLLDEGMSARDVAQRLQPHGISRRQVYEVARRREEESP